MAGDFVSSDLERVARAAASARTGILRVGYTPERDFWLHAAAVDACINLRYPAAGETSGIAIRLMGIGKPVLMSAGFGERRAFQTQPACAWIRGRPKRTMLVEYMVWLARSPRTRAPSESAPPRIFASFTPPQRVAEPVLAGHSRLLSLR